MTHNQINYWKLKEDTRHNIATEELGRQNLSFNYASLDENRRHNLAAENLTHTELLEQARHNRVTEEMTNMLNQSNIRLNTAKTTSEYANVGLISARTASEYANIGLISAKTASEKANVLLTKEKTKSERASATQKAMEAQVYYESYGLGSPLVSKIRQYGAVDTAAKYVAKVGSRFLTSNMDAESTAKRVSDFGWNLFGIELGGN